MEPLLYGRLWSIAAALTAMIMGGYIFLYTEKYLDETYEWREQMDKKTGTRFFTAGYPKRNTSFQYFFAKALSAFIFIFGFLVLVGVIHLRGTK